MSKKTLVERILEGKRIEHVVFSYGSEASFSGEAGMAYSGDQSPGNRGTYSVQGNRIHLRFSDGSSALATVHMRQNNGAITEVMYEGTLYATGLCE